MRVVAISEEECREVLERVPYGRLGCALDNQPYVVPVAFAFEPGHVYLFSTVGKKIEWMRQNPKVCLQVDEIGNRFHWSSVVLTGTYLELREPQYTAQKEYAREKLADHANWWQTPMAQRRESSLDIAIEPVFFRIDVESVSGLRSMPEAE